MNTSSRAGLAGLLVSLVLAAPAFAGPAVFVRVEGETSTLLARTAVTLPDAVEPNTGCPGNSAASAIELGTQGNWDRQPFTQTILGESHTFTHGDYWGIWVFRGGTYKVSNGVCAETLAAGEELLAAIQLSDPVTFENKLFPLWMTGVPSTVKPGVAFNVTVNRTACETSFCNPGEGHAVPAAGAAITVGGKTFAADSSGVAAVTLDARGEATLRATQPDGIPSSTVSTCVTDGADGFCGYVIPSGPGGPGGSLADTEGPSATITGLQQVYKRGKGPRTLTATVGDGAGTGLADVKLAITRVRNGKCAGFGNTKGRFRKIKCGRRLLFSVGPVTDVSFLLPARLGPGVYTFNVVPIDKAGNRQEQFTAFRVK